MYPLRRIFQSTKYLTNYIYTSSVKCKSSKKSDKQLKSDKSPEKEDEYQSEFLKLTEAKPKSYTSLDVMEEDADLNLNKKSKLSKKRQMQRINKNEATGLENFFKNASAKKALSSAAESVAKEIGADKAAVKYDVMKYLQTLQVTKEKPKERQYTGWSKETLNDSPLRSIFSNVSSTRIFNNLTDIPLKSQLKLNIWDKLEHEELQYMSKRHPRNHFEELINWTNEGKMWIFPIDNDQGLDEEAEVSFTQHVFLDQYLEPWCPKKGPLRRFMDLVLTGLGKNHYLSVEEKIEHIKWFQDYFEKQKKLLQEVGAMSSQKEIEAPSEVQTGSKEKS